MNGNPMLEQMLMQQFGDDPQMQAIFSMMQQRQSDRTNGEAGELEEKQVELEHCQARFKKAVTLIERQKKVIAQLQHQLEQLDGFQEDLALALGACTLCWGEDAACRACRGRGKPGIFQPDETLFNAWVLPATVSVARFSKMIPAVATDQ